MKVAIQKKRGNESWICWGKKVERSRESCEGETGQREEVGGVGEMGTVGESGDCR